VDKKTILIVHRQGSAADNIASILRNYLPDDMEVRPLGLGAPTQGLRVDEIWFYGPGPRTLREQAWMQILICARGITPGPVPVRYRTT
jgi:hypothetical protein